MRGNSLPPFAFAQAEAQRSARLVLRGVFLNAVLALAKFAGGVFGNTYALIADAAELPM